MQTTEYFQKRRALPEQQQIQELWINNTYHAPEYWVIQEDGRVNLYRKISDMNHQYLKVVLLKDGKTVRDAYFVNNFNPRAAMRGKSKRRF